MKLSLSLAIGALLTTSACAATTSPDAADAPPASSAQTSTDPSGGAPVPDTIQGTLCAVPGIPDGPGVAIFSPAGFSVSMVELILDEAEKAEFTSGREAKVVGTLTPLEGLGRDALGVHSMVVCPAAGTWGDCMPSFDEPSELSRARLGRLPLPGVRFAD